jgi:hypothetical protein
MNRASRPRRGLSTVVTSMILLVAAVLFAFAVAHYATNATKTRSTTEEVRISKERIWMNQSGAVVAFKIQNIGGKDLTVDGVIVRDVELDWEDIYYYRVPSGTTFIDEMSLVGAATLSGLNFTVDGRTFQQASRTIPLISSGSLLFYVRNPGNLFIDDIGETVRFGVFTKNGHYLTAAKVESATQQ